MTGHSLYISCCIKPNIQRLHRGTQLKPLFSLHLKIDNITGIVFVNIPSAGLIKYKDIPFQILATRNMELYPAYFLTAPDRAKRTRSCSTSPERVEIVGNIYVYTEIFEVRE